MTIFASSIETLAFAVPVLFLFGVMTGSFLNVCINRLPEERSIIYPPSCCNFCKYHIAWYHNIPLLSYLFLKGKCSSCKNKISIQYPLIELATGLLWIVAGFANNFSIQTVIGALFFSLLLGIAVTDAKTYIIPNEMSLGGVAIGLLLSLLPGGLTLQQSVIGALVGFLLLYAITIFGTYAFKKEAMGGGDIKMAAMLGAFLGYRGVLITLFIGSLLGLLIFGPISYKTNKLVPFGIFLALGGAIAYLFGDILISYGYWWMLSD